MKFLDTLPNWLKLVSTVLVCEAVGIIGSVFTTSAITSWYAQLTRPTFAPPNWVFGPVWTILYALMGVAAYLVFRRGLEKRAVRIALILFSAQLILNALWSVIFFGLRSPEAALIEIIVLWFAICMTIISFMRISRAAAVLLVPYIAWASFASYLNYAFWMLNR